MSQYEQSNNKILWINGLKGLGCLMVFFHHYALSFYKGVYYGITVEPQTKSHIDVLLGCKPYGFIINGNFAVCLFIILSGFLFARRTMLLQKEGKQDDLFIMGITRYFRLMPSVFIVGLSFYLLKKLEILLNINYSGYDSELNIFQLLYHIFILQWVTGDASVMGPFWCMSTLFIGAFVAVILAKFSNEKRKYMPLVYFALALIISKLNGCYASIAFGVLIADILCYNRLDQWFGKTKININSKVLLTITGIILLLIGLFFGGYPSYQPQGNAIYRFMRIIFLDDLTVIHSVAALFTVLGIALLPKTPILASKFFVFLGDISFAIFLIHEAVIELMSYMLVDKFTELVGNFHLAFWITMAITIVVVGALSILYHYLVENKINKLISTIVSKYSNVTVKL